MAQPINDIKSDNALFTKSEWKIIFLMAAVQFVNILDFMMVMPLGEDIARAMLFSPSHIGYLGGSYTAAACVAGLVGGMFLDRFDRRQALAVALFGLVATTALGGLSQNFEQLIITRVLAGFCGGPATALAISCVADNIHPSRRGRALGIVMGSFSMASIFGVPLGLELALIGGWRIPFFVVAGLGLLIVGGVITLLPAQRAHLVREGIAHLKSSNPFLNMINVLRYPGAIGGLSIALFTMLSMFMIVPNIATYVQHNLGFPRNQMSLLYLIGGGLSFFSVIIAGRFVDRFGSTPVTTVTTLCMAAVIYLCFINPNFIALPVLALFPMFMLFSSARMVGNGTVLSKITAPRDRASYMSIVSAVQHLAGACGAFFSSMLLKNDDQGAFIYMDIIAMISIVLSLLLPAIMLMVERKIRLNNKTVSENKQ